MPMPGSTKTAYPTQPRLAVGAIVFHDGAVLLVKRGQAPARGQWAIPGGSVRLGETLQEAAQREIFEETGIVIRAKAPVYTFDAIVRDDAGRIQFHYVIVDLEADFLHGDLHAGDDADDVRWVASDQLAHLNVSPPTAKLLRDRYGFR